MTERRDQPSSSAAWGGDGADRDSALSHDLDLSRRIDTALSRFRRRTGIAVAFGGPVRADGTLVLERFIGQTAGVLSGIGVTLGEGLGGRVVALRRAVAVNDYFDCRTITHRYDQLIRVEGFRAVVACPVIINRRPLAVLYGAFRNDEVVAGRVMDAITDEARSLEQSLVLSAALADRRQEMSAAEIENAALRERLRAADAEVRSYLAAVESDDLKATLRRIALTLTDQPQPASTTQPKLLTPREVDVLSLVGVGYSNARIADSLGLTVHTVKSYMKAAMSKLGATTRVEAVVLARRASLIA